MSQSWSNETVSSFPTNAVAKDLPWLGPREVIEERGWPMLNLAGTPSVDLPDHVVEAASRALRHPPYPGTRGMAELRRAIADKVSSELATPVDPDTEVLVTVGSMQGLHLAARVCCDPSHDAVAHAPSFFYEDLAAMSGVSCRWTGGSDGAPDWEALAGGIRAETSLVFVNTPGNPTGHVFRDDDLDRLARAVRDHDCWVVSDEAYLGYEHDGREHLSPAAHPDLRPRTVVVRSFSKTYAMGPWRVGYAVGPREVIASMAKMLQYWIIGVDSVAQTAALAALTGPDEWMREVIAGIAETRLRVVDALNTTGFLKAEVPEAGTTAWPEITDPDLTEDDVSIRLGRDFGIPAVQGRLFGAGSPHVRIPFGGLRADAELLVERLSQIGGR